MEIGNAITLLSCKGWGEGADSSVHFGRCILIILLLALYVYA
jgi:hypothetical protein